MQVLHEKDANKLQWFFLDPTKLWPEEDIPVIPLGTLILNRNPTDHFAEVEQVAFCPANVVPGIDFSEDPILQGRLFSYLDTQISRLGGPNFHQIPINRAASSVNNNHRGGLHQMRVASGRVSYSHNRLNHDLPQPQPSGFRSVPVEFTGHKVFNIL